MAPWDARFHLTLQAGHGKSGPGGITAHGVADDQDLDIGWPYAALILVYHLLAKFRQMRACSSLGVRAGPTSRVPIR